MNRVLRTLTVLLLGTCLVGVALAFTVLRPHSEVFPPTFAEGYVENGIPMRASTQVMRYWSIYPLREWKIGYTPDNSMTYGWQLGPFAFEEEYRHSQWPVAVERAARAMAPQKLSQKGAELMIYENTSSPRSWRVVISLDRQQLETNFDDQGKPFERSYTNEDGRPWQGRSSADFLTQDLVTHPSRL